MKLIPPRRISAVLTVLGVALLLSPACSDSDGSGGDGDGGEGGDSGTNTSDSGDGDGDGDGDGETGFEIPGGGTSGGAGGEGGQSGKPDGMVVETLPQGFTAEDEGGYKIVGELEDLDVEASNSCVNVLRVVVRDFLQEHIDFGSPKPDPWEPPGLYQGLVLPNLDTETRKPEADPDRMPEVVIEHFEDWYVTTEDVNKPYVMDLWLEPKGDLFVFDSAAFFPLDAPWNEFSEDDEQTDGTTLRNFLFTTEIHTAFEFKGDEVFNFRGDDDVWVFINDKLAVDIGGIHGPEVGNVDLGERADELGLEVGEVYRLDMFQAERNPGGSNFRIETSLDFKACGILEDDIIR